MDVTDTVYVVPRTLHMHSHGHDHLPRSSRAQTNGRVFTVGTREALLGLLQYLSEDVFRTFAICNVYRKDTAILSNILIKHIY